MFRDAKKCTEFLFRANRLLSSLFRAYRAKKTLAASRNRGGRLCRPVARPLRGRATQAGTHVPVRLARRGGWRANRATCGSRAAMPRGTPNGDCVAVRRGAVARRQHLADGHSVPAALALPSGRTRAMARCASHLRCPWTLRAHGQPQRGQAAPHRKLKNKTLYGSINKER